MKVGLFIAKGFYGNIPRNHTIEYCTPGSKFHIYQIIYKIFDLQFTRYAILDPLKYSEIDTT